MKTKIPIILATLTGIVLFACSKRDSNDEAAKPDASGGETAEVIYSNGKIYTVNEAQP